MKNLFFLILAALIIFAVCEKELTQPNGEEYEMKKLEDGIKISGMIDVTIKRANGDIERKHYPHNTIETLLKSTVAGNFQTASDFALNLLFNGNGTPPTLNEDGIILHKSTGAWYEMISSISGSGSSRKCTGTFTGTAGTFDNVYIGFHQYAVAAFSVPYATPTSWDNVILAAADTLTVEWTITVGA